MNWEMLSHKADHQLFFDCLPLAYIILEEVQVIVFFRLEKDKMLNKKVVETIVNNRSSVANVRHHPLGTGTEGRLNSTRGGVDHVTNDR